MTMRSMTKSTLQVAKVKVGRSPTVLQRVGRSRSFNNKQVVSNKSDLVVEGFPRSGNTYICGAIEVANRGRLSVASHFHVAGQLRLAEKLGKPCVIVIREPIDALSSTMVYHRWLSPTAALIWYVDFYEAALSCESPIYVAEFQRATTCVGEVVEEASRCLGIGMRAPSREDEAEIRQYVQNAARVWTRHKGGVLQDRVSYPVAGRREEKERLEATLTRGRYSRLVGRARHLYEQLVARSAEPE